MLELTPERLLQNSALVDGVAPWCTVLGNLELGILLLSQPTVSRTGWRRADFERALTDMGSLLPVGPTYFQRIKRAVDALEQRGALRSLGEDRDRRFILTLQGFAALILNMHVLREGSDPTLDGSEFELKRELVASWHLVLQHLPQSIAQGTLAPDLRGFFEEVLELTIWGRSVITAEVLRDAFDAHRLLARQRALVEQLVRQAESRLAETRAQMAFLQIADINQLNWDALGESAAVLKDNPALMDIVRGVAASAAPELSVRASLLRYQAYLNYLDTLSKAYSAAFKVIDIGALRQLRSRAGREG